MNAGAGLLLPFNEGYGQEAAPTQHLSFPEEYEDFHASFIASSVHHLDDLVETSSLSEYDLGGEGDIFKAPEPILEEQVLVLDPDTAAMSMISSNGNLIIPEANNVTPMDSNQNEDLLSEVFHECRKDLLAKSAIIEPSPEASDVKVPAFQPEMDQGAVENKLVMEGLVRKIDSFQCLSSVDYINGCIMRPSILEFQGMNLGAAFGITSACIEEDIQQSSNINDAKIEERRQKLSRYRNKRTKRNFGKKIKYACRKALADGQHRVRGRFAKSE
ncbi:zinc finger protein CONSTANS-LIKE 1 [Cocos nucifera]|uniref:Zinc finger protein CONSTANS-LIKE 1 n=1 Tax=Cocos nucifera TaxID=13894 RepID=A0A8K0I3F9_COCNU|nr:zinc finger protein CONSTANS-LIKE 1 [Cocos nucifera]